MPVYSEHVCKRYKEQCAACFCVDTIANFWVIWFFSLSPGYSDICSVQFTNMLREYAIFVGAAVSVTGVNMLLKMLLRSFAGFEKSHTKSEKEKSIAVKIFIAQFFNTALVPLLVYARINSLSETVCRGGVGEYDPADDATFGYNGMPCQPNERAEGTLVCEYGQGECRAVVPGAVMVVVWTHTDCFGDGVCGGEELGHGHLRVAGAGGQGESWIAMRYLQQPGPASSRGRQAPLPGAKTVYIIIIGNNRILGS